MGARAEVGEVIAERYRLDQELGRGGMATVYRARDLRLNRDVALKLLHSDLARQPPFRIRFRQEAQAAARLTHPNVVRVFDAGESHDSREDGAVWPFIAMELVEGELLSSVISRGQLTAERAVAIAVDLLAALEYAHRSGLVHRDVKPGNIMVTPGGGVKVMDFGIARSIDEVSDSVAQTTAILGTAAYFSPEQARGERVNERSDIYAAGIVVFEMLTGRPPFQGGTPVHIAYQHVSEIPVAVSSLVPGIPQGIDDVVARALHKNPIERFQSASDFSNALEAALHNDDARAFEPQLSEPLLEQFAVTELTEEELELRHLVEDASLPTESRRPAAMWLWAGGTLIFALVGAVLLWAVSLAPNAAIPSAERRIPDVANLSSSDATAALSKLDLTALVVQIPDDTIAAGNAIRTDPQAGEIVAEGQRVSLYISSGKTLIAVPDVRQLTVDAAKAALVAAGFAVGEETKVGSGSAPAGIVVGSNPTSGAEVPRGSAVAIQVSTGKVSVPSVIGTSLSDASALLGSSDYRLQVQPDPVRSCKLSSGNPVIAQSVGPGDVPQGSAIKLSFCAG
ncbi:MAG TPA: Stk1 family PASTA domain-containing Ser/Thr kinase [Microbacteriaceae bacterium]|nr:Stk1 family PASTA domain-containing Ser/Thr kinase [Microbacteriaceae bacterium]